LRYYFKASDENEYGPIAEEEIRVWLVQGRMNHDSLMRSVDSGEWRPLNDYPELMALLAPSKVQHHRHPPPHLRLTLFIMHPIEGH
jgi:hypothetical protein